MRHGGSKQHVALSSARGGGKSLPATPGLTLMKPFLIFLMDQPRRLKFPSLDPLC